jgi:hypothetical protein
MAIAIGKENFCKTDTIIWTNRGFFSLGETVKAFATSTGLFGGVPSVIGCAALLFLTQCTAPAVKAPVQWGTPVFTTDPPSAGSFSAVDHGEATSVLFDDTGVKLDRKDDPRTESKWKGRLTFRPTFSDRGLRRVPVDWQVRFACLPSRCSAAIFRVKTAGKTRWITVDSETAQPRGGNFVLGAKGSVLLRSGDPLIVEMGGEVTRPCPQETVILSVDSIDLKRTPLPSNQ